MGVPACGRSPCMQCSEDVRMAAPMKGTAEVGEATAALQLPTGFQLLGETARPRS